MTVDQELLAVFRAEVGEQIAQLRERLAQDPDRWDVHALFRLAHNIKGAARMVGESSVQEAAHQLEDLFARVRDGLECDAQSVAEARQGCRVLGFAFEGDGASFQELTTTGEATLRVGVGKLDRLIELASEMVALSYRMEDRLRYAEDVEKAVLESIGNQRVQQRVHALVREVKNDKATYDRLAVQWQDAARALRMVRVGQLARILDQAVQEAARVTAKRVTLLMEGSDTELDRSILQELRDPLIHLVRNAVAHGIESPDERQRVGKAGTGIVRLSASSVGGWVEVEVADDGRGIDEDAVWQRASELGLAPSMAATELIFEPGFSTAEGMSQLAGRGVGLDVVRQNVARLGGTIDVSSQPSRGTCFTLRVPLTRLTARGILVRVGRQFMAFPVENVVRILRASSAQIRLVEGRPMLALMDRPLPAYVLADMLGMQGDGGVAEQPALVVRSGAEEGVLFVNEVLGERELVVQQLGWNVQSPVLVGAAVIDRGQLCLVVDTGALLRMPSKQAVRHVVPAKPDTPLRKVRILVADDSVTSRTLEKNILTAAGYEVSLANDGEEAWQALQSGAFDLLISDVEMPRRNGLDLTRQIRESERLRDLPVILVTSLGKEEQRQAGAIAGANAYIVKGTFDQDALLKTVRRLI